jgi:hypothetical protein
VKKRQTATGKSPQPDKPAQATGKQPQATGKPAQASGKQSASRKQPRKKPRVGPGKRPTTGNRPMTSKPETGWDDWNLQERRIDLIRKLAVDIAEANPGPGMVLICNPSTEPSPLPKAELLDDHCAWCNVAIYYDRKMPSPADITRVCIACGLLLLEAEKKGHN